MNGDRLRNVRQALNLSQQALAEMVDLDVRQIWRYENGETEPSADKLGRIASALNVSTDYLVGLTEDPTPSNLRREQLSARERAVIAALRRGEPYEAIKVIVGN